MESPCKYYCTHCPVGKHSDPDTHRPEAQDTDQENTEAEPARPHGTAGGDHGKLHITGSTKTIPRHERHCPYDRLYGYKTTAAGIGNKVGSDFHSYFSCIFLFSLLQKTISGINGQPPMQRGFFSQLGQALRILLRKRSNASPFQASTMFIPLRDTP